MADQKIYEGRAELNIKPFLDALTKLETQSKSTADSLTTIFKSLDQAINQSLVGIQATVQTVAASVSSVGRAVAQANGVVQQGQGTVTQIRQQGQAAQQAAKDTAAARAADANAMRIANENQLVALKRSLSEQEQTRKTWADKQLSDIRGRAAQENHELATAYAQEASALRTAISTQQSIRDNAAAQQAAVARAQAQAIRSGTGNVGMPTEEAYNRAALAAQKAALTEQSLQKQLTQVTKVESAARSASVETDWRKMTNAQVEFYRTGKDWQMRWNAQIENVRRGLKQVEDNLNSLYRAGSQLMQLGSEFTMISGMLTFLGLSLAKNAGDFDFWLTRVSAAAKAAQSQTGQALDGTLVKTEEFRKRTLEIGRDVGILQPEEIAKGWYLYQSALGAAIRSTDDLAGHQRNVDAIFRASVITDTQFDTVVRGVTQAMAEFGMGAEKLPYALAVIENITQTTQAEFSDMLQAFKMAGPQAHRLGMDIGDLAAAFGMLSDQGLRGSQAGRLLQGGLARLIDPAGRTKDALQELFITNQGLTGSWARMISESGRLRNMWDTLDASGKVVSEGLLHRFADATNGMTKLRRESYLTAIFGVNDSKVWATMIDQYAEAQAKAAAAGKEGVNAFDALAASMRDENAQLSRFGMQWDEVSGSLRVRLGQALFTFQELKQFFGVLIGNAIIPLIQQLGNLAKGFQEWAATHPQVAQGLVQLAAKVAIATAIFGPLLMILGFAIQTFSALPVAIRGLSTAFSFLRMAIGTAITVAGQAVPFLGALLPPVLALVIAIGVLYLAWRNNWGGMRYVIAEVGEVIGGELMVLGKLLSGVVTLLTGIFTGKADLIRQGGYEIATALVEGIMVVPQQLGVMLANALARLMAWGQQMGVNLRVWGHNMAVSLANGMIDGIRYIVAAASSWAEVVARFFRSHSPPEYGPLKDIKVWGRNLVQTLADGMNSADFDALFKVADQVAEALKRNIEAGLASPSTYAASMGQATGLIQEMLAIVRGGGRVNEDFFASLSRGMGEWYEYIVKIALAYQDVYAAQRQLDIEKEKLETLKKQREELDRQNQARQTAFEEYLGGTEADNYTNNADQMVDPTTAEGRAKIEQMRRTLSREEFQNWVQWQQRMWDEKAEAEDKSLQAQEDATQAAVDTLQAQLDAASKQYELYQKMYEYAVRMYEMAEEQKRLEEAEEQKRLKELGTQGTPEQVKQYLGEIGKAIGPDQAVLDEQRLRDQAGGDDIKALAEATHQKEREQERMQQLDAMNRRKRAEFEMALINATSEEEKKRIKEQMDSWDAAYKQEKQRLQERVQMAEEVQDAAEKLADATKAGREAAEEARYHNEIVKLLGEQTAKILDANELKARGGSLDEASILAQSQLRDEERKLFDLQAYGDQKKLEFEQRIREAGKDPEKLRRIKEEQEAWETAYKKALEAQQLRVELARRAQQDISDETSALNKQKGPEGWSAPDWGEGPTALDEYLRPPWLNKDGSINWDFLGLGPNSTTGPRPAELQSIKLFDDLARAIKFLGDESVPSRVKVQLLGEAVRDWITKEFGEFKPDLGLNEDAGGDWWLPKLKDWQRFADGFGASWNTFFNWTLPLAWMDFKGWWDGFWPGISTWWVTNFGTTFPADFSGVFSGVGAWFNQTWMPEFTGSWTTDWEGIKTWWTTNFSTPFAASWSTDWTSLQTWWTTNFSEPFSKSWSTDWTSLSTWFRTNFSDPFSKSWSTDWDSVRTWWDTNFSQPFKSGWDTFWGGVPTAWETFKTNFQTAWETFWAGLKEKWDNFWQPVKDGWDSLVNGVSSVLQPIIDFVNALSRIHFPSMPDWLKGGGGGGDEGGEGHAQGLMTVPFNNYRAVLHAGERVLTAREAAFYNSLEAAMSQMATALARAGSAGMAGAGGNKTVILNVARVDATNPDEGRAFLNRLAFLS